MFLISQWYRTGDSIRDSELSFARRSNEASGLFDHCLYMDGSDRRLTFLDIISHAKLMFPDHVCVASNTDIVFDESIKIAAEMCGPKSFISLARWETKSGPRMLGRLIDDRFFSGSQDAWVFRPSCLPEMKESIPLGEPGCDQAVLGWAVMNGLEVSCPSLEVRSMHIHSQKNDWSTVTDGVHGVYAYPELTTRNFGSGSVLLHRTPFVTVNNVLEVCIKDTRPNHADHFTG